MFLILFSLLIASPAQAEYTKQMLENCDGLTQDQWFHRYDQVELKVISAFEKNPEMSVKSTERDFFEVVFPQDLPKTHPMKGAFLSCFGMFENIRKAVNGVQVSFARNKLESCLGDAYKRDPPPVVGQYIGCLKKLKF